MLRHTNIVAVVSRFGNQMEEFCFDNSSIHIGSVGKVWEKNYIRNMDNIQKDFELHHVS